MQPSTCTIDGFGPLPMVRPSSFSELGETIRRAASENQAIYPVGGQTQLGFGNPPTKQGVAVDLRGFDQVIDFPARDMTITVQPGIAIAKLQALLAPENLRLPIDVPQSEQATLGGILATNTSGPRRLGYGTLRDYVIGISAVNDEGNEFKAGGRVVKNVAGYDICKLLVGSLGTLGVISQVTLKLRPRAEQNALIAIRCTAAVVEDLLAKIHGSRTRPVCVELLNRGAAHNIFEAARASYHEAPWTMVIGYEGNSDAVNWQVQQLVKELGVNHSLDARVGESAGPLWDALVEWPAAVSAKYVLKQSYLPSAVARVAVRADANTPQPAIQAHAGSGVILFAYDDHAPFVESSLEMEDPWTGVALRMPHESKASVAAWSRPPADAWLMRKVKAQFDPRGLFNPGRFVDGI